MQWIFWGYMLEDDIWDIFTMNSNSDFRSPDSAETEEIKLQYVSAEGERRKERTRGQLRKVGLQEKRPEKKLLRGNARELFRCAILESSICVPFLQDSLNTHLVADFENLYALWHCILLMWSGKTGLRLHDSIPWPSFKDSRVKLGLICTYITLP